MGDLVQRSTHDAARANPAAAACGVCRKSLCGALEHLPIPHADRPRSSSAAWSGPKRLLLRSGETPWMTCPSNATAQTGLFVLSNALQPGAGNESVIARALSGNVEVQRG